MKGQFQRVCAVIQRDKSAVDEECKALILRDLSTKLQEYFDLSAPPTLTVTMEQGVYQVELRFSAERIKSFYLIK